MKTPGKSTPRSGGRTGAAPVDSTSTSYGLLDTAPLEVLHFDGPAGAVNAADLVPGADLDLEKVAEPLRRGDEKLPPIGDHAAEIIGQATVGEGDVAATLEDEDFGVFIQAAEPAATMRPRPRRRQSGFVWRTW